MDRLCQHCSQHFDSPTGSCGSTSGLSELNLDAEDLPVEPDRQTPDATAPRQYVRRKKSQQWAVD